MLIQPEDILATGNLELLSRHAVEGFITGYHKSPFHGFSVEFSEHRQYNPGESTKHIDWKLYGRTDKLFIKRFEEETNLRCRILIDASSSMQFKGDTELSKLQYSLWCSAVLLQLLKKQRDATGITIYDEDVVESTRTASSGRHYKNLLHSLGEYLDYKSVLRKTDIVKCLHDMANQLHRRSLIVLFTDLLSDDYDIDQLFRAIQHIKHNKHELIIFNTLDADKELSFEYENRPLSFEDLETGEKIKIQSSEVKDQYRLAIQNHIQELRLRCGQYKVEFIDVDITKGVENVMIPFLVKRNRISS
ncbi:MAG: DUF58 domain-containing protein [Bacteroidia bacterium]